MSEFNLYAKNIPYSTKRDELRSLFSSAGHVVRVNIPKDRGTGRPRGIAFVEMSSMEECREAIRLLHGWVIGGRDISVEMAK